MSRFVWRLDWLLADLEHVQRQAWTRWIQLGATTRRQFTREFFDLEARALSAPPPKAKPIALVPDAYLPPGARRRGSVPLWY